MRVPRVRFTVRWLLLAVAILCLPLGWTREALDKRRERYTGIADNYARQMAEIDRNAARNPGWLTGEGYRRTREWHEQRRQKWERAACYPSCPTTQAPYPRLRLVPGPLVASPPGHRYDVPATQRTATMPVSV
jgi:hypothetical protein